jgi:Transposase and inactivated derivatives
MEWIQGVEWAPSGVRLQTITSDCNEHFRPVSEMQTLLAWQSEVSKSQGKTSFSDWRRMNQDEVAVVAQTFGFNEVRYDHAHYMFESDGRRYIVPAGVLMSAMFRPFHGIAKYLFAPQGLDNLCMPYGNCKNPEMLFFDSLRAATGIQLHNARGIVNSLSWMHCFPSARQMWCSVLEYAKQGRLDLTLPDTTIQYFSTGHVLASGDTVIQGIRIRLMETHEQPLEQFSSHSKVIEFERIPHKKDPTKSNQGYPKKTKQRYPIDRNIPLHDGESTLTDSEWEVVKVFLIRKKSVVRNRDFRRIVNMQLQKLSQGLTWGAVVSENSELYICRKYLNRWKADGRWEEFIQVLTGLRSSG